MVFGAFIYTGDNMEGYILDFFTEEVDIVVE